MNNDILDILKQCEGRLISEVVSLQKIIKRHKSPFPIPVSALTMNDRSILQVKLSAREGIKLRRKVSKLIKELSNGKCDKGCSCRVPTKRKSTNLNKQTGINGNSKS
jgi:hypothetical protein